MLVLKLTDADPITLTVPPSDLPTVITLYRNRGDKIGMQMPKSVDVLRKNAKDRGPKHSRER